MAVMKKLSMARSQLAKNINEIPIKWGRYIGKDMKEQKVIFFGHEKAIYGTDGDRLDQKLVKIEDGISDAFSEDEEYGVNDYCIYMNSLYKFTTAKPAGAWDGAAVVPVSISQEISSIKAEVEGINSNLSLIGSIADFAYANWGEYVNMHDALKAEYQNFAIRKITFVRAHTRGGAPNILAIYPANEEYYLFGYYAAFDDITINIFRHVNGSWTFKKIPQA